MELLEKLDILSGKVDELLLRLNKEQEENLRLNKENAELRRENRSINEQKDAVKAKVEHLLERL